MSPLTDIAHQLWLPYCWGWTIDATVGNGKDTLFLSEHAPAVIGIDIQPQALQRARERLHSRENVHLFLQSHETFPDLAYQHPVSLIVYNLGYLPGSDRQIQTQTESTLRSLEEAHKLLEKSRGCLSLLCYRGHPGGLQETHTVEQWLQSKGPYETHGGAGESSPILYLMRYD